MVIVRIVMTTGESIFTLIISVIALVLSEQIYKDVVERVKQRYSWDINRDIELKDVEGKQYFKLIGRILIRGLMKWIIITLMGLMFLIVLLYNKNIYIYYLIIYLMLSAGYLLVKEIVDQTLNLIRELTIRQKNEPTIAHITTYIFMSGFVSSVSMYGLLSNIPKYVDLLFNSWFFGLSEMMQRLLRELYTMQMLGVGFVMIYVIYRTIRGAISEDFK